MFCAVSRRWQKDVLRLVSGRLERKVIGSI